MRIKSLQLKNFKRFTDLTLQNIPENTRLVLLIGANGSGKSSVFDAFEVFNCYRIDTKHLQDGYYSKEDKEYQAIANFSNGSVWDSSKMAYKPPFIETINHRGKPLYGRTSFRQVPILTKTGLGSSFDIKSDDDRPRSFIDKDERFENDLEYLFGQLLRAFFRSSNDKERIKESIIAPINNSLKRIFSKENGTKLELLELIPPLEGNVAQINFRKGTSTFHYNLLSAGEKEVFNILINLTARQEYYRDGILYFDEIDLHLNTKLQYNLLKEITENWLPDNCQLWTASHSLGFIQYAKDYEQGAIFDFDDYDFDLPRMLSPLPKDTADIYEIAVSKEFLPQLFKDYKLFFVENKDRLVYAEVNLPNLLFIQEANKQAVYHKAKNGVFYGLIDRDFLTDDDIGAIEKQYPTLRILRLYSVENYLYHPDNLNEYYGDKKQAYDKEAYKAKLAAEKDAVVTPLRRKLALIRTEYPFFREPEHNKKANQNRFKAEGENLEQVATLEDYLSSDKFDDFYKVFPMKDYATQLSERQNLSRTALAKTAWFRQKIEAVLRQNDKAD